LPSRFVHLHVHSEYSILDSSCKIAALLERAAGCGMDALALTDHGVMSGVVKFYRQARKRGIKPILGCEIYVAPGDRHDRTSIGERRFYHLVLLAENEIGYRNLLQIVSRSHTEGFYYRPRADRQLLREYSEGLIALSACESGLIPRMLQAGRLDAAEREARELQQTFGDESFFIEIQHHGTDRDARLRGQLIALARSLEIPLVATNDVHYLAPEDRLAHEVLLNIRASKTLNDPDHRTFDGEGFHFRTTEEMEALFADVPDAIANTRRIADRCELALEFDRMMIPPFDLPEGAEDPNDYIRRLTYEGIESRYGDVTEEIRTRLEYELSVITKMEYSTYFLIVWDFVRYARDHGISVGPGRGSAAGSLVSYCLGITSVDPLKYGLLFERFLNPDRISLPDFDIDFCVKGRDEVIRYVRQKYGGEEWWNRIAQIATFDRMAARSVVRDVGRVLGVPYGVTDRVAKMIPFGWGLRTASERVAELRTLCEQDDEIRRVVDIGLRLEGLTRNASTHAAGIVIAPDALSRHVPLLRLGEGEYVTQFDMGDVEAVGLLKIDFLGLRNLTLIDQTRETLAEHAGIDLCVESIPLDDEATYALICEGRTSGIFQLESSGMTNLIRRVQPDRFEDLIALLALYRPGPLESGMTDDYADRRRGLKPVTYAHPSLREVLEETYGLPIYQDQLMLMVQKLAGFTLAEADVLRKAMGKKIKDLMASLREKYVAGCLTNGLSRDLATGTFEDIEKFSRYGFGKAHATSYAFVSYWTAYLKANYPTHFMASLLSSVQGDLDKVAEYVAECREMEIEILPPDINESQRDFTPLEERRIRFGLGAVKHVGSNAVQAILSARRIGEPFRSFFNLCDRVQDDGLDRESLEALVKAGAFDRLGASRLGLLRHVSDGLELMQIARRERVTGQTSLFGDLPEAAPEPAIPADEFGKKDLLTFEKELLGLYLTAHPLDDHRQDLQLYCLPLQRLCDLRDGQSTIVGGRIKKIRRIDTRRGDQMAFVTLEDGEGEAEATAFPRVLDAAGGLIAEDALVGMSLSAGTRNGEQNLVIEEVFPLSKLSTYSALSVTLRLDGSTVCEHELDSVLRALGAHPGEAPVRIEVVDGIGSIVVVAGDRFHVMPSEPLRESLSSMSAVLGVSFGGENRP
jgi:DNA polymerase-3 subunit alpha